MKCSDSILVNRREEERRKSVETSTRRCKDVKTVVLILTSNHQILQKERMFKKKMVGKGKTALSREGANIISEDDEEKLDRSGESGACKMINNFE